MSKNKLLSRYCQGKDCSKNKNKNKNENEK